MAASVASPIFQPRNFEFDFQTLKIRGLRLQFFGMCQEIKNGMEIYLHFCKNGQNQGEIQLFCTAFQSLVKTAKVKTTHEKLFHFGKIM